MEKISKIPGGENMKKVLLYSEIYNNFKKGETND